MTLQLDALCARKEVEGVGAEIKQGPYTVAWSTSDAPATRADTPTGSIASMTVVFSIAITLFVEPRVEVLY